MARRFLLALALFFVFISFANAVITAPIKLSAFLAESDYVVTAKIESVDAAKNTLVLVVQDDLKGKIDFRRLNAVIRPDEDAVKLNHVPQLLKRLAPDLPVVVIVSRDEKEMKAYAYTNGTWMQLLGKQTEKDRAVWVLTHGEPFLRKMYKGTTAEFVTLLKDIFAGKAKAPDLDDTVAPGFGPEAPAKSSRLFNPNQGDALFAVIPTLGIAGPLAILAILFPTVFGGVLILFRQWTAFIMMFSINSTLYILSWWKGEAWLGDSWWGSDLALWSVFTGVTALCTIWAWRRQLRNLEQGADALDTPPRTEFLVLIVLTVTCLGFIAGTWLLSPPPATDIIWNLTLVLAAGIVVGLLYKAYRAVFETMLPMATEGVMLGVASLASLVVLVFLARVETGAGAPTKVVGSSAGENWQFKGMKWPEPFQSKRPGLFASSPLVVDGKVYAASSHPTFGYGYLYRLDLDTGKEEWKFGGGTYKRPISSPVLDNGKIYIGEGWHGDPACKVYCVGADDGKKVWEFQTANQTEATPAVEGGLVFTGCGNDGFRCVTAGGDGKAEEVWRFPPKDSKGRLLRFASGAWVAGDRLFAATGVDRDQESDKGETAVFCLDAKTGSPIWKTPMPLPVWTKPVLSRAQLFVGIGNGDVFSDDPNPAGAVYCLDPANGSVVWKLDLPNSVLQAPAVDKYRVYVGCRDGNCYGIDRKNGKILWQVNLGAPVVGTPGLAGDKSAATAVYVVSNAGRVACLAPESGLANWTTTSLENKNLVFITAPAIATRAVDGGEQHLIVLGAGNHATDSGKLATLFCLEDLFVGK